MKSVHRYRALSAADRWLVIEAATLLVVVRLGLAGLPFSVVRSVLDRVVRGVRPLRRGTQSPPVDRLAWAVAAASRRLPFRSTCLVEALAVDAMMRRWGYASEIRFGVRPPRGGVLAGHAWVEYDGTVVSGSVQDYSVLSTLDAE